MYDRIMINSVLAVMLFFGIIAEIDAQATKKMKILCVVDVFPAPTQTFILNQVTGLIDRGHEVMVLSSRNKPHGVPNIIPKDAEKYDVLSRVVYVNLYQNLDALYENLMREIPDIHSFDIVHCQFGHLGDIFAQLKQEYKLSGKLVTSFRGADASFLKTGKEQYNFLFREGDLFLPVCQFFGNILQEAGCDSAKIKVHHSAIDCNKFAFKARKKLPHDCLNIVSVTRIIQRKGLEYSVRAINNLCKKYPNISYSIIGSGPYTGKLKRLIKELGAEKNIKILGFKTHEEVAEILSKSHLFVLTPVTDKNYILDGIPNVLMEALACGIPVVSSDHSGISELIEHGKSGFLVPEFSIGELQNKIEYLIRHPEMWSDFGIAGKKHIEKEHNIDLLNNNLESYFLQLLS